MSSTKLSINKLEKFLKNNGFLTREFFIIGKMCCYINIISVETSETFLIYIPSKYDIEISEGEGVYKIKELDIANSISTVEEYTTQDDNSLSSLYNDLGVDNKEVSKSLECNYDVELKINDSQNEVLKDLRDLSRQIKRLKLCLKNIKYRTAIIYKTFLCVVTRHDSIECYNIEKYKKTNRRIFIITDLDLMYNNMDKIKSDITFLYEGISNVLNMNQDKHCNKIHMLLDEFKSMEDYYTNIFNIKNNYQRYFNNFNLLLQQINQEEIEKNRELNTMDLRVNSHNTDRYNAKILKDLENIKKIKQSIILNILKIREKKDNILLVLDNMLFDNIIMLDQIKKNCKKIRELIN